ncbi:MAG TPA: phage major capsid protein [Microbacterium sp.]|nr:phage major capsid protein [Microbacterium sp.]
MARDTYEAWIPEEYGSTLIQQIERQSAAERFFRQEPMGTDTKHVPRSGTVDVAVVAKGGTYTESTGTNDEVLLTARKLGSAVRIADEDIADVPEGIIEAKKREWAISYAKFLDNATIGVTAAENGTTVPFTSVYKSITTTNAATGYTANANLIQSSLVKASGQTIGDINVTYDNLVALFGLLEGSDYFDEANAVVVAHPYFKTIARGMKDSNGRPILVGVDTPATDTAAGNMTFFGYPVQWSVGARMNATASKSPTGNRLLVVGNRDLLILGKRSGPEYKVAGADTGVGFLTDENLLKARSRRGFAVGNENGIAVLEARPTTS